MFHLKKNRSSFWILVAEDDFPVYGTSYLASRHFHSINQKHNGQKSLLAYNNNDFHFYQIPFYTNRRGMSMVVLKILKGALRIRYLLLGGAIGGGYTLQKVSYF